MEKVGKLARMRLQGTTTQYQLKELLSIVKPKREVEVIHTLMPELFHRLVEKLQQISYLYCNFGHASCDQCLKERVAKIKGVLGRMDKRMVIGVG